MVGRIKNKEFVAVGTLRVTFELNQSVSFKPGQYVFVNLPKLNYPDERGSKRQFSINNSPSQSNILTITTRISNSGFKKTLQELPEGSEVELGPIAGIFTLPENPLKPLVFIAGGIGITPFLSMLEFIKETRKPYQITLLYSNRNQSSTPFLEYLQQFTIPDFKLILTMTDDSNWKREKRIINSEFIKEYFPDVNSNLYMVVGPPAMVEGVENALIKAGVREENIIKENFTGY